MEAVEKTGDVNSIGNMLESLTKSPYTKGGDLRYNGQILFYLKGNEASIIPFNEIKNIKTEIATVNRTEENYVCVVYNNGVLKIKTNGKNVLLLKEDMLKYLTAL